MTYLHWLTEAVLAGLTLGVVVRVILTATGS